MPKNKHRKPPPSNVEERRERAERVVHREDMSASLGEVLEHEHVEEAIELLYKQDELSGKAPQPEQSATSTAMRDGREIERAEHAERAETAEHAEHAKHAEHAELEQIEQAEASRVDADAAMKTGNGELRATKGRAEEVRAEEVRAEDVRAPEARPEEARATKVRADEAPAISANEQRKAGTDAWNIRETTAPEEGVGAEEDAARVKRSVFRFVSPVFMVPAAWHATGDLINGVRRALSDLRDAAKKARRSFA